MTNHIPNMRALLNHKDPTVAAQGRKMVTASRDPAVRALLNGFRAASCSKSPAERAGDQHGPRTARGEKAASRAGDSVARGGGKAAKSAPISRFAHWANVSFAGASEMSDAEIIQAPQPHYVPMSGAMRQAEMRREIARNGGRIPGADTPEKVAAFVAAAAAKCRPAGAHHTASAHHATPKPTAPVKHDMTTPSGVAAFVAQSAAKARGQTEADRVAASTLAAARRAGVIR